MVETTGYYLRSLRDHLAGGLRLSCSGSLLGFVAMLASGCGSPEDTTEPAPEAPRALSPAQETTPAMSSTNEASYFAEAAAETGLDFVHWNGMSEKLYYAEMMGSGVALFDYDNDGDLDVYMVQGNALGAEGADGATFAPPGPLPLSDRLFRNDLEVDDAGTRWLRFTDVTEESGLESTGYGMGVTAADFDNDGWLDLYVTNLEGNRMFRGAGLGADGRVTFEDVTEKSAAGIGRWSVPAVAFDYDRDGWLDLFVGNYVDFSAAANKSCTDELGLPNYCGPLAFAPLPDTLLRGAGDGTFTDVSYQAGIRGEYGGCLGAVATDFDGDGWPDLYVANDGMPNQLWINRRDGSFENRALLAGAAVSGQGHPEASMGLTAADFDGDGDEDLFITHLQRETNTIYVNDGRGLFEDRSAASGLGAPSLALTGFGAGWLDFDNDGWLDLLTVNGAVKVIKDQALAGDPLPLHQRNQLFRGRGDGSFEEVSGRAGAAFELSEVSRGAAFGDLDNDGDTDVVINNNSGRARVLLNQVGQEQEWLGLSLVDAAGRRNVPGVKAGVDRGEIILWRRIGATASYASSSDPRLLFGLGDVAGTSKVVVEWPDGRAEHWPASAVTAGAYTTLRQGGGRAWTENGG